MRRGRNGSPPARNSPNGGRGNTTTATTTTTTTTHRRPATKRRPCQDIRGPQRLISYQIPNANPDKELNVIRSIIARETALADLLAHVSKYKPTLVSPTNGKNTITTVCFGALDQHTTELLLGMRITSVQVTEAIQDWRSQLTLPRPFVWQKNNYLQGMGCDVDFLHFDKNIAGILGNGRTKRNPFVTENRNVDELSEYMWGPNETPKSLAVSGIDGIRLRQAARLVMEEEMRCGKADHRKPPPTWYIQRKKRMLALGINLVAGADAPSNNASPVRKSKPPPKKKIRTVPESQVNKIQKNEESDTKSTQSPLKEKKRKKRLLEMNDDQETDATVLQQEIKICSRRKKMWGWSRDGRMFLSSAEAWLLPPPTTQPTPTSTSSEFSPEDDNENSNVAGKSTVATELGVKMQPAATAAKAAAEEDEDEEERMEVRAEISMGLPSKNGVCGSKTCASLVVSIAALRRGGFLPTSSLIVDALMVVAPPTSEGDGTGRTKGNTTKSSKNRKNKGTKSSKSSKSRKEKGKRTATHKRNGKDKEKHAKKLQHESRMALGDAAIAFMLDRLLPTIGGVAWEMDGFFLKKINRKFGPLAMFGGGPAGSGRRTTRIDSRYKYRVALRVGRFWCAISSWIPRGEGLELDISTLLSSHSKRLCLDRQALERLLGPELILSLGGTMQQEMPTSTSMRPHSRSESRPGSRSSTRSRSNSRPGSRSGSRPVSRPVSRGNGSSSSNSRPSSRGPSGSRPSSRNGKKKKSENNNYGDLPPLSVLTMAVLKQCVVVVETSTGPEFFAQPSVHLNNMPPVSTSQQVVGNPILAPEIIAAATPSLTDVSPVKLTAGALMLSRGQENTLTGQEDDMGSRPPSAAQLPVEAVTEAVTAPPPPPPPLPKRKKERIKILAQGMLVGGLYFMVDMYFDQKKEIFYISATYPISGHSIYMTVTNEDAEKCKLLLDSKEDDSIGFAKSVLSRLDLDYNLPPGLILRFDDEEREDEHELTTTRPLFAVGALADGMISPVRASPIRSLTTLPHTNVEDSGSRPMSPALMPIFAPTPKIEPSPELNDQEQTLTKEEEEEEEEEEERDLESHRKTLNSMTLGGNSIVLPMHTI